MHKLIVRCLAGIGDGIVAGRICAAALSCGLLLAQTAAPPRAPNTFRPAAIRAAPLVSPEVHADRTVTFRLSAPAAPDVSLFMDGDHAMEKGPDGIWSVTLGPFDPEIYSYTFRIGGATIPDPANSSSTTGEFANSLLDIPATPARFDQVSDVAHGTLQIRTYTSTPYRRQRSLYVYVPPQYESEPARRFPVLYLRHGNGGDESDWVVQGRAGVILENLIAEHKAVPMIIVMTYGESNASGGATPEGIERLGKELLDDVIPVVEKNYRVIRGRDDRAIAGLSMGGGQAFTIGLKHLDLFAWVGEFSSGLLSDADFKIEKYLPNLVADAPSFNKKLKLLFLSCGTEDPRLPGQLDLMDDFTRYKVGYEWYTTPGAHEWKVWRHSLRAFLPKLFQR